MAENRKEIERLKFLKECLEVFQSQMVADGEQVTYNESLDEICNEINSYYWNFIAMIKEEKYLISKEGDEVPTNANIYKIISATEFSIIRLQPIREDRILNAKLAYFVSSCFYRWWFQDNLLTDIFYEDEEIGKIWEKFTEDRLIWLMNFDENHRFPFFLNSQVWMLIDILTRGKAAL